MESGRRGMVVCMLCLAFLVSVDAREAASSSDTWEGLEFLTASQRAVDLGTELADSKLPLPVAVGSTAAAVSFDVDVTALCIAG